jgi:uncharacterized protein
MTEIKKRFYDDGLPFECTACGECCKLGGGFVYPTPEDLSFLAQLKDMTLDAFKKLFTDKHEKRIVLKNNGNDCIFWSDNKCQVYNARPLQCRTYPFWPTNLKSTYRWNIIKGECEGIGQGRIYSKIEIKQIMRGKFPTADGPDNYNKEIKGG